MANSNVGYIVKLPDNSTVDRFCKVQGYYGSYLGVTLYADIERAKRQAERLNGTVEVLVKADCEKWINIDIKQYLKEIAQ